MVRFNECNPSFGIKKLSGLTKDNEKLAIEGMDTFQMENFGGQYLNKSFNVIY